MNGTNPKASLEREVEALRRRLDMKIHTAILDAEPGDVLLMRTNERLTEQDRRDFVEALRRSGVSGVHVVMVPSGVSLQKLSAEERRNLRKALNQTPRRKRK